MSPRKAVPIGGLHRNSFKVWRGESDFECWSSIQLSTGAISESLGFMRLKPHVPDLIRCFVPFCVPFGQASRRPTPSRRMESYRLGNYWNMSKVSYSRYPLTCRDIRDLPRTGKFPPSTGGSTRYDMSSVSSSLSVIRSSCEDRFFEGLPYCLLVLNVGRAA